MTQLVITNKLIDLPITDLRVVVKEINRDRKLQESKQKESRRRSIYMQQYKAKKK